MESILEIAYGQSALGMDADVMRTAQPVERWLTQQDDAAGPKHAPELFQTLDHVRHAAMVEHVETGKGVEAAIRKR